MQKLGAVGPRGIGRSTLIPKRDKCMATQQWWVVRGSGTFLALSRAGHMWSTPRHSASVAPSVASVNDRVQLCTLVHN